MTARRRLTREGWWLLAAAGLLLAAGWLKTINFLLIFGYFLLLLLLINAVGVRRSLRGLSGRRVYDEPVWAGVPTAETIELTNTDARSAAACRIEGLPVGRDIAAGETVSARNDRTFLTRGEVETSALRAVQRAPFGLVESSLDLQPAARRIVWPQRGNLSVDRLRQWLLTQLRGDGRPHRLTRAAQSRESDLLGLRPFRPGDSPRHIHWRTTARRGELMVRELAEADPRDLLLVLAPSGEWRSGAKLEAALSFATTVVWDWCRQPGDTLWLLAGGPTLKLWPRVGDLREAAKVNDYLAAWPAEVAEIKTVWSVAGVPEDVLPLVVGDPEARMAVARALRRPVAWLDPLEPHEFYSSPVCLA